jgi:predicted nuclease of predicted toxin-antitoxin system
MPSAPAWRFLVDENLPRDLAERLRAAGYAAEHVVDVGLRGRSDPEVYAHAQAHGETLVTIDLGFGNVLLYPAPHAGIVVARLPETLPIVQRLELIVDALATLTGQPLEGALVTVEVGRVRVRR